MLSLLKKRLRVLRVVLPSSKELPRLMSVRRPTWARFPDTMFSCRFSLDSRLHPDWMLMLFFAHTHLTVTVALCLLLVPKVTSRSTALKNNMTDFQKSRYGLICTFFKNDLSIQVFHSFFSSTAGLNMWSFLYSTFFYSLQVLLLSLQL